MQFEQNICEEFCTKREDDVKVVTEENICSVIQKSLAKIIEKEDYKTYDITIKVITTEGGNYLGELYEIDVSGQTETNSKTTNIFIKHIPNNDFITSVISVNTCYNNELFAYKELSDVLNELYDEAGVPEDKKFKMVKCYSESSPHALIFENLSKKGYETLHRTRLVSLGYAKSAIKELAKFHVISFILKFKRKDFFEKYIETLKSPIYFDENSSPKNDSMSKMYKKLISMSFDNVETELDNKEEKMEYLFNKMFDTMSIDHNNKNTSVKCMCHGDFKSSNLLMKVNDDGETEIVTIDYQLLNYGTPIYDFLYFIFLGTDRKFRKRHLEYLKDLYHDTLTESLGYFDLDINYIYPRDLFDKDFHDNLVYGLVVSSFYLPVLLTEEPDLVKNGIEDQTPRLHASFKERINGVFQEYIEWGLL